MTEGKEPFVPREDRPSVNLNPDMPITEMRVRDLSDLLNSGIVLKKREFKELIKDIKYEKLEIKELKLEKNELKELKLEKFEKNEKIELEPIPKGREPFPDPGPIADPRIDRLIEMMSGMTQSLESLAKRVEALEKRG